MTFIKSLLVGVGLILGLLTAMWVGLMLLRAIALVWYLP